MGNCNANNTYCPIPWSYIFVATNGSLLSCVIAASTEGRGLVKNAAGEVLQASSHELRDLRNSEVLKKLRKNMLAGRDTPEICTRCIDEEQSGLISRRSLEKAKEYFTYEQARECTKEDGAIPEETPIVNFNMRLGNFCNLACRTCNPSQSSFWYKEWYETRHKGFYDHGSRLQLEQSPSGHVYLKDSPYLWYKKDHFWNNLLQHTGSIRELHFSGGEPFLSREHISFLKKLVSLGHSKHISLDYNSNLTILPKDLTEIWQNFHRVSIGVSLDGTEKVNSYIRYPSNFSVIEKNLEVLDGLGANIFYWVTTTICSLNIMNFPDLIDWIIHSPLKKLNRPQGKPEADRFLSYHLLRKPLGLNIRTLPDEARKQAAELYEAAILRFNGNKLLSPQEKAAICKCLESILQVLLMPRIPLDGASSLNEEIRLSDAFLEQSFADLDPKLWAAISK